jgi:DNA primase
MRFPPEFIDRLRNHISISEVIGKRVPIKRHGREFHALCPFHKEKSPSFTVNDEKGFFHCFGCGAHGDTIGFIKDFEGISYPEAVERLAIEAGLPIPAMTREAEAYERKRHTLEDVVALAAQWFVEQLHTQAGTEARHYIQSRGLSDETVKRFGIGFAPNGREALKTALMKQNISEAMLVEAGLLAKTDDGTSYDRFRGRLMFPIRNAQGKTVAFGGRILASAQTDKTAKYLNSPETPLFKKGEMLFAYDIARQSARDKGNMVVAEGYMDVIALHQAGFTTAVAPLGTAITESQLKLLWRVVSEPTLCLDGDAAGERAMWRAAELALPLLKPEVGLKFAFLTEGEDPDSLLRKAGVGGMRQALEQSKILSKALRDHVLEKFAGASPEKRAGMEQHLMELAERIADPMVKRHYRDYFKNEISGLQSQGKQGEKWKKKGDFAPAVREPLPALPSVNDDNSHLKGLENQFAALILLCPEIIHHPDIEEQFGHMDFLQAGLDKLRTTALEITSRSESMNSLALRTELLQRGHGETVENLLKLASRNLLKNLTDDAPQAAHAWARTYENYTMTKLEHEKHEANFAFQKDMSQNNLDRLLALQKQIDDLHRMRYAVTSDEQNS